MASTCLKENIVSKNFQMLYKNIVIKRKDEKKTCRYIILLKWILAMQRIYTKFSKKSYEFSLIFQTFPIFK